MTQEVIKKLHELEQQRDKWYELAGLLFNKRNLYIRKWEGSGIDDFISVLDESDNFFDELIEYIVSFANNKVLYYNKEIEKL